MDQHPLLIKNYLNKVIKDNSVTPKKIEMTQHGLFYLSKNSRPLKFSAQQVSSLVKPEFSWSAVMRMLMLPLSVKDSLLNGEGRLVAKLFSFIPVASSSGEEILKGELIRYLAEIPWYPNAILLQPDIIFSEVDSNHVSAKLTFNNTSVTVIYEFNSDGLISAVTSSERKMKVGSVMQNFPWGGFFSNFRKIENTIIPTHAEAYWDLPDQRFTYFVGDVTNYKLE